jgi:ubiquinone/menaquinone biosynthesis C-methylase UbiE
MDEHHHIFDPKNIEALESEERKTWQNQEEIIQLLNLKPTDIIADLGCGSGYFTVPLSRKVKKVYAIDIQPEMLEYLENKIKQQKILNIETLLSTENEIPLQDESIDLLMTVNTIHEFRNKEQIISEIRRVLKPEGKAVIIDFKKEETGFGPPVSIRLSKEQAKRLLEKQGLPLMKSHDLKYDYLLIFEKN